MGDTGVSSAQGSGDARAAGQVDFFVSYAAADRVWAEWVAWQLEAAGYRTLIHAWDSGAGAHFVGEMHQAAIRAARTVAVLSATYLTSAYGEAEWQAAWAADPSGVGRRLVTVRVEDCPRPGLLAQLVGIDLFGVDEDTARRRLLVAAGMRGRPAEPPSFPGGREVGFPGLVGEWEAVWQPGRSPFPGLDAFEASRAGVFHGRGDDTRRLSDALTNLGEGGLLVVVGPSGCGKSSLVAAGLAPRIAQDPDWLVTDPLVVAGRPVDALARLLALAGGGHGLSWAFEEISRRLEDPAGLAGVVRELLAAAGARRLLLVVDQAEELLAAGTNPQQRASLLTLLATTATAGGGLVRVVASLRSEYLDQLLEETAQVGLRVCTEPVQPLGRDLLPLVIRGPARMAGLRVDDELVARLVTDTGDGQGLPLLAYTLARLYTQARDTATRTLTGALYDSVGGVQGALITHAAAALAQATADTGSSEQQVLAALLHLVTVGPEGRPTRRRIPLDSLTGPQRTALTPFVTARLLTIGAEHDGPVTVEVAHERLLTAWPPLHTAIDVAAERLRQRAQADTAADDWQTHGRPTPQLWNRARASTALALLQPTDLTPTTRTFLTRSRRRGQQLLAAAFALLTVLLLIATTFGVVANVQRHRANSALTVAKVQRDEAQSRILAIKSQQAAATDPALSRLLALAAYQAAPTPEAQGALLSAVAQPPVIRTADQQGGALGLSRSPDGRLLAAVGIDPTPRYGSRGTIRLWSVADPTHPKALGDAEIGVDPGFAVAFSPEGDTLVTGGFDGKIRLWRATGPQAPRLLGTPVSAGTQPTNALAFREDGRVLATASDDGAVRLWSVTGTRLVALGSPLAGHTRGALGLAFSPNGRFLITTDGAGVVRSWNVSDPFRPVAVGPPAARHGAEVNAVAFAPDGRQFATGSGDQTVRRWTLDSTGTIASAAPPLNAGSAVHTVAFSPDGRQLAAGTDNGTTTIWDPAGTLTRRLPHPKSVQAATFLPSGVLATSGNDGWLRLWAPGSRTIDTGQPLTSAVPSPTQPVLAVGGTNGNVSLWNIADPAMPSRLATLPHLPSAVQRMAVSDDGRHLAVPTVDGSVHLWDISTPGHPTLQAASPAAPEDYPLVAGFTHDGRVLATGLEKGTVVLWDTASHTTLRRIGTTASAAPPVRSGAIFSVAFSANDHVLAAGGGDYATWLYDVRTPAAPRLLTDPLSGHTAFVTWVTFAPVGSTLAVAGLDGNIDLWNLPNPAHPDLHIRRVQNATGGVNATALRADGLLAMGNTDGSTWLYDLRTRPAAKTAELTGPTGAVATSYFTANGRILITANQGGAVVLWDTDPRKTATAVCATTGKTLTTDEWRRAIPDRPYQNPCAG